MIKEISSYEQQAIDFLEKTNTKLDIKYLKFDKHFNDDNTKRNIFEVSLSKEDKQYLFNFGDSLRDSCKEESKLLVQEKDEEVEIFAGWSFKKSKLMCYVEFKTTLFKLREIHLSGANVRNIIPENIVKEAVDNFNNIVVKEYNKKIVRSIANKFENVIKEEDLETHLSIKIQDKIHSLLHETILVNQANEIEYPTAYDVLACLTTYDPGTFEDFCANYGYDSDSRKAEKIYKAVVDEYKQLTSLFSQEEIKLLSEIR